MAGINFVRRWVMGQMKKTSDDGIMITLPDSNKVDLNVNITMDRLLRNGINPDEFTNPQQVDNAINMINSRMVERAIPANSAEGRGITEALLGKRGQVIKGKFGKPFAKEIESMEDIADKKVIEQMYRTAGPRSLDEDAGYLAEFIADDVGKVLDDLPIAEQNKFIERAKNALRKNVKKYQEKSVKELMESGQVTKGARGMKKSKKVQDREMFQAANERLTSDVDTIIKNIKRLSPMDAMKEANLVIGRKGYYKNLSPEESKKILKDTEDHIFERDIPEEDFATGGRAGYKKGNSVLDKALAAASVPYNFGKGIIGNVSNPGAVTDVSLTGAQLDELDSIAQSKGTPTGTIDYSDYGGPTKTFSGIDGMDTMGASLATTMGGTGYTTNPDGSINYTGGAYDFDKGNVVTDFIDEGGILGAVDRLGDGAVGKFGESVYDVVNPEEKETDDDYDFSDIEGQTAGLGVISLAKGALGKIFGPEIAGIIVKRGKDKIKSEIGKKIVKPVIKKAEKKIKKKIMGPRDTGIVFTGGGGPAYTDPNTGVGGGQFTDSLGNTDYQDAYDPGGGEKDGGYIDGTNRRRYAGGGITRANFVGGGMGRRGFLKLLAGAGAGIAGLKSGLVNLMGKGGTKEVAKEVVKQSASTPPPYFFKLAEKIKKLGSDTTPTNDRTIAKSLKSKDGKSDYILEEDVTSGDTIIKKVNKEGDEMITDVEIMELRKGEVVRGKDGKPRKTPDEYEEVTEANARIEGDTFNDPYYSDGIEIDDILREVDDIPVPKASGGIARMLGE